MDSMERVIASFVVELAPLECRQLGRTVWKSLHGLLFHLLGQADPTLAKVLHTTNQVKPFTVSMLQGDVTWADGRPRVVPESRCRVRYTTLVPEVFAVLGRVLLEQSAFQGEVEIDGAPFQVENVRVHPNDTRGWGGITSHEQLHERAGTVDRFDLAFCSPTTFRQGNKNLLFPLPASVFGSYWQRWRCFSGVELSADLIDFVAENVAVEQHRLQTEMVPYGPRHQLHGFTGRCTYRVLERDPLKLKELNALADYALYCGTGQKTTQGLGQTRRVWVRR
jgi:CRISPR-associated endoribonuclease Cas6